MYYRYFKCSQCNTTLMFPKYKSHYNGTSNDHIKTVYCPICKKKTDWTLIDYMGVSGSKRIGRRKRG